MFAARTNWRLEPNRFTRAVEEHRRSGKALLDLTASNPTTCGFAYPDAEILTALADPRALQYNPESKGLRERAKRLPDITKASLRSPARPDQWIRNAS